MGLSSAIMAIPQGMAQSAERHPLYEPLSSQSASDAAGNLFLGAKVTASGTHEKFMPELAVDGKYDDSGKHWACENLPV